MSLLQIDLPEFRNELVIQDYLIENLPPAGLIQFPDSIGQQNPLADLYLRLMKDKNARLTGEVREQLEEIIKLPDYKPLEAEHKLKIWNNGHHLINNKNALTKFLHSVDWDIDQDEDYALSLMRQWTEIDKEDALHLLSYAFSCNPHYSNIRANGIAEVRRYAVERLQQYSDEELQFYLLQLVMALRYENRESSPLLNFLLERAGRSRDVAVMLHWYLISECDAQNSTEQEIYKNALLMFGEYIKNNCPSTLRIIQQMTQFKNRLNQISNAIKRKGGDTGSFDRKKQKLRTIVAEGGEFDMMHFPEPIPYPMDPNILLTGVEPSMCTVFLSKMLPIKMAFNTTQGNIVEFIYKNGDDLRQDQLIIQMIRLMDSLLKNVQLDFRLTPYKVLATSISDGFVEFVPKSMTIFDRLQDHKVLQESLDFSNSEVSENFIQSCAGYCVITYLLGIGDRHLENLLIDEQGKLFHIDFGFILGKDPKPMPPPMKLCKEMVDAMGGERGAGYNKFRVRCYEAFVHLRNHCKLITNLFYLMIHSGLPGIAEHPLRVIEKLYDRFKMTLNEEEADKYMMELINESVSALMPQLMERLHVWAIYWKKI